MRPTGRISFRNNNNNNINNNINFNINNGGITKMSQRSSFVSPANSFFYKRPISNFALQTTQISSFFLHTNNKFQFQRRFLTTTETQKTTKEVTPDDNVKIAREKAKNKFYNPAIEYYLKAIEGYIKGNDVIAANKLKFEIACANMELFQKEVETQQKLGAKLKDQFYRSEALKQFRSFLSTQTENPDNYRVAQSHYLIGNFLYYFLLFLFIKFSSFYSLLLFFIRYLFKTLMN